MSLRVRYKSKRRTVRENRRLYELSIDERPEYINKREEFGHRESDTIVGTKETDPVLLTLDERKTRKRNMLKIKDKTSNPVGGAIERLKAFYDNRFRKIFRSATRDYSVEFPGLSEAFGDISVYYPHPHSVLERYTKSESIPKLYLIVIIVHQSK